MTIVADAIGVTIDAIDKSTRADHHARRRSTCRDASRSRPARAPGSTRPTPPIVGGRPWFTAHFYGHVDLPSLGLERTDDIDLSLDGEQLPVGPRAPGLRRPGRFAEHDRQLDRPHRRRPGRGG